jgi:hypothetical protein
MYRSNSYILRALTAGKSPDKAVLMLLANAILPTAIDLNLERVQEQYHLA